MEIISTLQSNRWSEYRDLRLTALQGEPTAFSPGADLYLNYSEEDWKNELIRLSTDPYRLFFAEEDSELIAMGGVRFYGLSGFTHNADIQSLYVLPQRRGAGVGKALLTELITVIERSDKNIKNIFSEIISSQQASVSLHEACGFSVVGSQKNLLCYEGQYYDNYLMQRVVR